MEWISSHFQVASPLYFLFLLPFIFFFFSRRSRYSIHRISLPDAYIIRSSISFSRVFSYVSLGVLSIVLVSLALTLTSPGIPKVHVRPSSFSQHTRDIAVVFDASGSMKTTLGLSYGRKDEEEALALARETLRSFCESRSTDRFALLIFSDRGPYFARSFVSDCDQLVAPLEGGLSDRTSLISQFSGGTDIVDALLNAPFLFTEETSSSRIVMLISDLGHAGSASEVVDAISYLEEAGIKVYILGINPSSRKVSSIKQHASRTPHVSFFEIEKVDDFQEVYRAISALEPSAALIVRTETVSIQEANRTFLLVALAGLALWALMQIAVRRIS